MRRWLRPILCARRADYTLGEVDAQLSDGNSLQCHEPKCGGGLPTTSCFLLPTPGRIQLTIQAICRLLKLQDNRNFAAER
jgi:hypothetical protein